MYVLYHVLSIHVFGDGGGGMSLHNITSRASLNRVGCTHNMCMYTMFKKNTHIHVYTVSVHTSHYTI